MTLRTAVIGVGHLGRQHARIHSTLAEAGLSNFVSVCDIAEDTARTIATEREVEWATDWRDCVGRVDAVSLAVPTQSHCEIACGLLEAGIHTLVEKPISRTLAEADRMIAAAEKGGALLQVGHLERFNPALVALRPHVRNPVYFEIHRVGEFTARSLDIDVVLDLMIHDLDIVQWLVGEDVEVVDLHAVGIPILTNKVDAVLEVQTTEPLRAEIVAFLEAARDGSSSPVSGNDGRNALALALRAHERIQEHAAHPGVSELSKTVKR